MGQNKTISRRPEARHIHIYHPTSVAISKVVVFILGIKVVKRFFRKLKSAENPCKQWDMGIFK